MPASFGTRLFQGGALLMFLLVWYVGTTYGDIATVLLPNPLDVAQTLAALLRSGAYLEPLGITLFEIAIAFLLAASLGLALGYAITRSAYAVRVFDPLLVSLYAIPAILFFPLYVLLFGLGVGSKIALGTTIGFFPIVLNTIVGFTAIDKVVLKAADSLGASGYGRFRYVLLPAAFPVVLNGLRMGLIVTFLSVLGGETIASFAGLGHQIVDASEAMDTATLYSYATIVVMLAAALNILTGRAARAPAGVPR